MIEYNVTPIKRISDCNHHLNCEACRLKKLEYFIDQLRRGPLQCFCYANDGDQHSALCQAIKRHFGEPTQ